MDSIQRLVEENKNGRILRQGIVITGQKRHGKDTVSELFRDWADLDFAVSSRYAIDHLGLMARLRDRGLVYATENEAFDDRDRHRSVWFEEIRALTMGQDQLLGRSIFRDYPVYNGIRNREELLALVDMGLVHSIVWVDASERLPTESTDSMTVTMADATHVVDNNGPVADLRLNVRLLINSYLERTQ